MAKVITYSRTFPAHHPKKHRRTFFVEKVLKSFLQQGYSINDVDELWLEEKIYDNCKPKHHTIRAGKRFKAGDMFSPRVWSGRPYHTKQVILADDIEVKKVFDFKMTMINERENGTGIYLTIGKKRMNIPLELCTNDGLTLTDFIDWFNVKLGKPFKGQIICWNDEIEY